MAKFTKKKRSKKRTWLYNHNNNHIFLKKLGPNGKTDEKFEEIRFFSNTNTYMYEE